MTRIGIISSVALTTPPMKNGQRSYGGLEVCAYNFAEGLADLGHDVSLIASKDSRAPSGVELIETVPSWENTTAAFQRKYAEEDGVEREWEGQRWLGHTWNGWRKHEEMAFQVYKDRVKDFEVVGDHSWSKWSYTTGKQEIVGTTHSISSYQRPPRESPCFLGVSRPHARHLTGVLRTPHRVAWNPVKAEDYPLSRDKADRILSLNRVMVQKGIHSFVNLCEKTKTKGDVVGEDTVLNGDPNYVNAIKQSCAKSAVANYVGAVSEKEKLRLLQQAKVLVAFVDAGYQEVFGLSLVEALLSGTPVVSANTWGATDIIENGKNGYLVDSFDEACSAVAKIMDGTEKFDPEKCRESAMRFSLENSSKAYEKLLLAVKGGSRW